jgi:hypothetical protein
MAAIATSDSGASGVEVYGGVYPSVMENLLSLIGRRTSRSPQNPKSRAGDVLSGGRPTQPPSDGTVDPERSVRKIGIARAGYLDAVRKMFSTPAPSCLKAAGG